VHEDPTRMMGQPDGGQPHGNARLLIAGLIAVIVGLVIAILVIAGDDGSGDTTSTPSVITTLPTTDTSTSTDTTTETSDTTTSPTTTTTTPTTTTTTETTTTTPEDGSGGIEAP